MSPLRIIFCVCLAGSVLPADCHAEQSFNVVDHDGRLRTLHLGKGWAELRTDVRIPLQGWQKILSMAESKPEQSDADGKRTWKARAADGKNNVFLIEQSVRETDDGVTFHIKASAETSSKIEGVMFWIDLPVASFADGLFFLNGPDAATQPRRRAGRLPAVLPVENHLAKETISKLKFMTSDQSAALNIALSRAAPVLIQDGRKWGHSFEVAVEVQTGSMNKGDSAELDVTLSMAGNVESAPAAASLDFDTARYHIDGIGGNYCFDIESPVTRYTLDHLKVAFARTEMTLEQWAPVEPAAAEKPDWSAYVAHDKDGSHLRHEFELMQELSRRKIPYCKSVWKMPPWMYTETPKDPDAYKNKIAPDKWPKVLEAIGTYLLYAKEKYRAEPDYFSFNEPDYGVRVYFSPEDHRDAIKRIGAQFRKLGLKTRLLLGDVTNPRDTWTYVDAAAADPEALQYAGAVSFHSWGGAKPVDYAAWTAIAHRLKMPLIVAEAGPDSSAWEGAKYSSFEYFVEEMAHYQTLFLESEPQAIMYWEYTADYSLLQEGPQKELRPTERYCLQRHWTEFIPAGSDALKTRCDNANILFTAFKHGTDLSLHLANPKWTRQVAIKGIPPAIKTLNVVRTARGELFKHLEPIPVVDGKVKLELPAQSLTTLSTMDATE